MPDNPLIRDVLIELNTEKEYCIKFRRDNQIAHLVYTEQLSGLVLQITDWIKRGIKP